ncbi:MAG: MBOAT family O-acyltransferase [Eubacteriales bacterium]|nr:MBOAT family O-acyltransferase [Eubacteriales bacterium]
MSFQSFEFAAFLLLALLAYYAAPAKLRIWVLLLENAAFFMWADLRAGIWLLISIGTTWITALALRRMSKKAGNLLLLLCLCVNLGLLVIFKYLPVWDNLINAAYGKGLKIVNLDIAGRMGLIAPLGISFYTLQAVGYLLDVASGKYPPEKNPAKYAVFVSFFPNILSGPIERGDHFLLQLDRILKMKRRKLWDYDRIVQGMISILLGFFLKMVIADRVSILVDYVYGMYQNSDSFTMLVAALFYAIQIYCDFGSYSCIAVGIAQIMGFSLIRNFSQPYFAVGISGFWRRWHISLSSWLRDYVYIPLGGNRKGILRRYANLLAVFLVSGLWHGGAPTFLVWGLLHGGCQIIEDVYRRVKRRVLKGRELPFVTIRRLLARLCTFLLVSVLWIFFRSDTLEMAKVCLVNLFTKWQGFAYAEQFIFVMGLEKEQMLAAAVFICFLFILDVVSEWKNKEASAWIYESATGIRWGICLFMIVSVFVFGIYGPGFDPSGFIYVNF